MDFNTQRKHSIETTIDYYRNEIELLEHKLKLARVNLALEENKLFEFYGWTQDL